MHGSNRDKIREALAAATQAQKNGYIAGLAIMRVVYEIHVAFCLFGMVLGMFVVACADRYDWTVALWGGVAYTAVCAVLGIVSLKQASDIKIG